MMTVFVTTWRDGLESVADLDGVSWFDAPVPSRWHRCTAQTKGFFRDSGVVHRCACGAISRGDGYWMERNSRLQRPRSWLHRLFGGGR
jgi:hypothetical protein